MTLPGVNRQIAQNIVDHRTTIGGRFLKIDDLALVSGIGAEKLEQIRPEICLRTKSVSAQSSNGSSTPSSLDLIVDEQNNNSVMVRSTPRQTLNINKATIFELQQVQGINQELAAKLIARREKRGLYKSLDDLLKVKGLSPARLGAIKTYLSVQDDGKASD
jgi:competence ComEA-like helix-hairpin-helix protein